MTMTDAQEYQVNNINSAAFNAVKQTLEPFGLEPEWDAEWIGELSDDIADICERFFGKTEAEVYPYIEDDPYEGTDYFTTPDYWDCDCEHDYIHPKTETICKVCGANYNAATHDYSDSMTSEVIKFLAAGRKI